jgi:predicted amidohydrolase
MRIAVVQLAGSRLEDWRQTWQTLENVIAQAAARGAALAVLPECAWPAYVLGSPADYHAARAAGMPGPDELLAAAGDWARRHHLGLCIGHVGEQPHGLTNAATLIASDGRILGTHEKCFLWDFDRRTFVAGQSITPFDTPWGRVGLLVCADARLPEIAATLVARGARLLLQPTAWVNAGTPEQPWNPQPDFLIAARAREFRVPVASASKAGVEGETLFVGRSLISDTRGRMLTQAGSAGPEIIVAEVGDSRPRAAAVTPRERRRLLDTAAPTAGAGELPRMQVPLAIDVTPMGPDTAPSGEITGTSGAVRLVARLEPPTEPPPADGDVAHTWPGMPLTVVRGVAVAGVTARDAARFAPLRCLALDGAHVVVVFGEQIDGTLLRARAMESRIFVVAPECRPPVCVAPSGRPVAPENGAAHVVIDPQLAVDKCVAWRTDVLDDRTPALYAL